MNRYFKYELRKISKGKPIDHPGNFDGKVFRWDFTSREQENGVILTVQSETAFDMGGLKLLPSASVYFIPYEQPTAGEISNEILTELVYQHISRDTDAIFNITRGSIVLQPPTLKEILDSIVGDQN